jgi:hypothetical protein
LCQALCNTWGACPPGAYSLEEKAIASVNFLSMSEPAFCQAVYCPYLSDSWESACEVVPESSIPRKSRLKRITWLRHDMTRGRVRASEARLLSHRTGLVARGTPEKAAPQLAFQGLAPRAQWGRWEGALASSRSSAPLDGKEQTGRVDSPETCGDYAGGISSQTLGRLIVSSAHCLEIQGPRFSSCRDSGQDSLCSLLGCEQTQRALYKRMLNPSITQGSQFKTLLDFQTQFCQIPCRCS